MTIKQLRSLKEGDFVRFNRPSRNNFIYNKVYIVGGVYWEEHEQLIKDSSDKIIARQPTLNLVAIKSDSTGNPNAWQHIYFTLMPRTKATKILFGVPNESEE